MPSAIRTTLPSPEVTCAACAENMVRRPSASARLVSSTNLLRQTCVRTTSLPNSLIARAARAFSRKNESAWAATRRLRREISIAEWRSPAVVARLSAAKTMTTAAIDGTASSMTTTIAIDITASSSACSSCAVTSDWMVSTERLRLRMSALWCLRKKRADLRCSARTKRSLSSKPTRVLKTEIVHERTTEIAACSRTTIVKPIASTQISLPSAPCRARSIDSCICSGTTSTSTSIRIESATIRTMSGRQCDSGARNERSDTLRRPAAALLPFGRDAGFQRDAGERAFDVGPADGDAPGRRIHDDDAVPGDAVEDDEVVHVPVQDRRPLELGERVDADLDAARGQADPFGEVAQLEQRLAAAARHGELAQLVQSGIALEVAADRRNAGEAALVELARRDERHLPPAPEAELEHQRRVSPAAAAGALADAVVQAAQDRVEQPGEHRPLLDRHQRVGEHAGLERQRLAARAAQLGRQRCRGDEHRLARAPRLRHLAGQRRDLVDGVDARREQAEALLRIGAKGELELDPRAHRCDRGRGDEQLDDERIVRRRNREERLAGLDRLTLRQRRERHLAVLRRAQHLLGVHFALHAQPGELAAGALPVLDHAGQPCVDEPAFGLGRLDLALDARRRAARAREPALLRRDLVALLRRLLARQVALGRDRGDVIALRRETGEQPLARADLGAQGFALLAQPLEAPFEHEPVDGSLLARGFDLAPERRLLGFERLANRAALAVAFLAQPLAADDGEQVALADDGTVGNRQAGDVPVDRRLQPDQPAARVDEGGDAMHRGVPDDGDEGDQRCEEHEGGDRERRDAAPVRRQRRADLRAGGGLDGDLPEQRGRRSVHVCAWSRAGTSKGQRPILRAFRPLARGRAQACLRTRPCGMSARRRAPGELRRR